MTGLYDFFTKRQVRNPGLKQRIIEKLPFIETKEQKQNRINETIRLYINSGALFQKRYYEIKEQPTISCEDHIEISGLYENLLDLEQSFVDLKHQPIAIGSFPSLQDIPSFLESNGLRQKVDHPEPVAYKVQDGMASLEERMIK